MNAGNASGYSKEQIQGMMGVSPSGSQPPYPTIRQNFLNGEDRYLSYPVARTNQEVTGDTLRIKCIEYVASGGDDFKVEVKNFYGVKKDKATGEVIDSKYIPNKEERLANNFKDVELKPTSSGPNEIEKKYQELEGITPGGDKQYSFSILVSIIEYRSDFL